MLSFFVRNAKLPVAGISMCLRKTITILRINGAPTTMWKNTMKKRRLTKDVSERKYARKFIHDKNISRYFAFDS